MTERDYRLSRMSMDEKVADFMTPRENLVVAPPTPRSRSQTTSSGTTS